MYLKKYYGEKTYFWNELKENMNSRDTVYQWRRKYVRENKSNMRPTLTANMGMGGHNVPLVLDRTDRRRKLTQKNVLSFKVMTILKSLMVFQIRPCINKQEIL